MLRTPERRARFAAINAAIEFTFFDAIDGATMAEVAANLGRNGMPYTPGAVGCALSHVNLWRRCIDENRPLTIIEDDAVLRRDFADLSAAIIGRLPAGWDLILWGWNFDSVLALNVMPGISEAVLVFSQDDLRKSMDLFQAGAAAPCVLPLDKCFGIPGYSMSPKGAAAFTAGCIPLANEPVFFPRIGMRPNNGIDVAMNRLFPMTQSFVVLPPLVATPNINEESATLARKPAPG